MTKKEAFLADIQRVNWRTPSAVGPTAAEHVVPSILTNHLDPRRATGIRQEVLWH